MPEFADLDIARSRARGSVVVVAVAVLVPRTRGSDLQPASMRLNVKFGLCLPLLLVYFNGIADIATRHVITKRNYSDQSVRGYLAERTCWWNEVCKEEFHSKFRCRCPRWSYCRAPGRYYDAHCSITRTGYIWTQPETSIALDSIDK